MTTDLTGYTIKDFYTRSLVRVRDTDELSKWLWDNTVSKSDSLRKTIDGLVEALESDTDWVGHGNANGLYISRKKGRKVSKKN